MQEAGMGTSEVMSKEVGKALEGGCEDTKDQGEGLSGLTATDKGKGKEKEVQVEGNSTGGVGLVNFVVAMVV